MAKQVAPKFLSDQLTNYYGSWGAYSIGYATLPPTDALARLYVVSAGAFQTMNFTFNEAQNFSNSALDIWTRASINNAQLRLFFSGNAAFTLPSGTLSVYAAGGTTDWRHDVIPMSKAVRYAQSSPSLALARTAYLQFYFDTFGAGVTCEIGGLTFRRL